MKTTKRKNGIQKKIDSTKKEIEELQSRLADVENSLSRKKQSVNFDNADSIDEIKSLKNDRDLILELIEEKQITLQKFEDDHDIQIKKEDREKTLEQLLELANEAEGLEDEYHQKMEELDRILQEKIPEIIHIRSEWKKTATNFMNVGDKKIGKGLREGTARSMVKAGKGDERTDEALLEELRERGANISAVTSNRVLSSRYFNHISNAKELDLFFGENLFNMMHQSNVWRLLEENNTKN